MTTIRLTWQPNPASELVTSYEVWAAKSGAEYLQIGTSERESFDFVSPEPAHYSFALKAANFAGVSGLGEGTCSPNVPTPPAAPKIEYVQS
jgi:hypothetical protein